MVSVNGCKVCPECTSLSCHVITEHYTWLFLNFTHTFLLSAMCLSLRTAKIFSFEACPDLEKHKIQFCCLFSLVLIQADLWVCRLACILRGF